jgi:hypothetical protein
MSTTNPDRQASFEDLLWNLKRLKTESEKKAYRMKQAEDMQEERAADRAQDAADKMERQRKKDLARERQHRHCALVRQQNLKPAKKVRNVNDVSVCILASHLSLIDPLCRFYGTLVPSQPSSKTWQDCQGPIQIGSQNGMDRMMAQSKVNTNAPTGITHSSGHTLIPQRTKSAGQHSP